MVTCSLHSYISKFFETYKKWITSNPQLVGDIENTVKYLSYLTAGCFNSSTLTSEVIYSISNLLMLYNDRLLWNKNIKLKLPRFQSRIKLWLTIIEYTEVLLEISACRFWGETGKWLIILFVQMLKAIMRLLLVHRYEELIIQNPPIPPLNREKLNETCTVSPVKVTEKESFLLKRSGTLIRTVNSTKHSRLRMWTPLSSEVLGNQEIINRKPLVLAETLYIIKPLLHLGCLSVSGRKYWKPWFLSLLIDLASLKLYSLEAKTMVLNKEEKQEIFRRKVALLLYILRSPFYDNCSRMKIYSLLNTISTSLPFARLIADPVAKYLPYWQDIYFYMWSC